MSGTATHFRDGHIGRVIAIGRKRIIAFDLLLIQMLVFQVINTMPLKIINAPLTNERIQRG